MITLEPLPHNRAAEVLHLELGPNQESFVGSIQDMVRDTHDVIDFHVIRSGPQHVLRLPL